MDISRRHFLCALGMQSAVIAYAEAAPRVGCQANGFALQSGDFPGLLSALGKMKEMGYTGFEWRVHAGALQSNSRLSHQDISRQETVRTALGQGDFDFHELAAAVKKTGWSGWLIDEEGGGPGSGNTAALGPDREHIRRLFGV